MNATPSVLISATTLTADEIAACYRNGCEFRELTILFVPARGGSKRTAIAVNNAFAAGAEHVWKILPAEDAIITMTDRGGLAVKDYDDDFAPPDFPNFRCRVRDFVKLLEATGPDR